MANKAEHKSLVVADVDDTIEVLYNESGTDTTSNPFKWYFSLSKPAKGVFIKSDKILQIVEINKYVLKSPILIAANGSFADNLGAYTDMKYSQVKLKITVVTTKVEVFGRI